MHQIKVFKGVESEILSLEEKINAWLRESGAKVVSMTGNIAPQTQLPEGTGTGSSGRVSYPPSDILVILLYEAP
jgi:hypothetical protein